LGKDATLTQEAEARPWRAPAFSVPSYSAIRDPAVSKKMRISALCSSNMVTVPGDADHSGNQEAGPKRSVGQVLWRVQCSKE